MKEMTDIDYYIQELEICGDLHPSCLTCIEVFYPQIREGKKLHEIFAPRHKASRRCESGRLPHCTCDACF